MWKNEEIFISAHHVFSDRKPIICDDSILRSILRVIWAFPPTTPVWQQCRSEERKKLLLKKKYIAKLYYGLIQVLAHLVRIVFYIRGEGLKVFLRVGTSCEPSVPVTLCFFFSVALREEKCICVSLVPEYAI